MKRLGKILVRRAVKYFFYIIKVLQPHFGTSFIQICSYSSEPHPTNIFNPNHKTKAQLLIDLNSIHIIFILKRDVSHLCWNQWINFISIFIAISEPLSSHLQELQTIPSLNPLLRALVKFSIPLFEKIRLSFSINSPNEFQGLNYHRF